MLTLQENYPLTINQPINTTNSAAAHINNLNFCFFPSPLLRLQLQNAAVHGVKVVDVHPLTWSQAAHLYLIGVEWLGVGRLRELRHFGWL